MKDYYNRNKKRFTEIDALRGLAAVVVVLYHYIMFYGEKFGHEKEGYIEAFAYGHYGVQLFFIISGYVIINKIESMGYVSEVYLFIPIGISLILAHVISKYVEKPSHDVLFKIYKERQTAMPKVIRNKNYS